MELFYVINKENQDQAQMTTRLYYVALWT